MKVSTFNALAIAFGAFLIAAIAATAWRTADDEELPGYTGEDILITVDYVTHCQTMSAECYAAAGEALDRIATKDCLVRKPGRRAMARGALIWLNGHVELHPRALEDGLAHAVKAIWPRCVRTKPLSP